MESRAFRLDWKRVTNKPKVKALMVRLCGGEDEFRQVGALA